MGATGYQVQAAPVVSADVDRRSAVAHASATRLSRPAAVLGLTAAIGVASAAVAAIVDRAWAYGGTAPGLVDQATAQDVVGLLVVAPLLALLAVAGRRGSGRARLLWPGACLFVAYNAAIYAFAVDLGPLFLAWVATLGLSSFAGLCAGGWVEPPARRPPAWPAVLVMVVAVLFASAWIGQVVGDIADGGTAGRAAAFGLPTNPVHVLDLALLLPGAIAVGVRTLRRRAAAWELPSMLLVLALMCLPILTTPAAQAVTGRPVDSAVLVPFGLLLGTLTVALVATVRRDGRG
jgi:hypothetical protein